MKKIKKYPLLDKILISFISLVMVLSISSVVFAGAEAYEASKTVNIENVENLTLNISEDGASDLITDSETLGGASYVENLDEIATSTTEISLQNNIGIYDRLLLGDKTSNLEYHIAIEDVFGTASSTVLSIQNKEGKTIYIDRDRIAYQPTGGANVLLNLAFGTSTSAWVDTDKIMFIDGIPTGNGLNIFDFSSALTQTTHPTSTSIVSTVHWGADNPGVYSLNIYPVNPGIYFVGYATSSEVLGQGSVTTTASILKGKIYIPYWIVK